MFKSSTKIRVRYSETDQMGVVYHANYFNWFEVARAESIRELGYTYAEMEKLGVIMPVIEVQCRYLRPAYYDQLLTISVQLPALPTNHKIEFIQEVHNENEELLASGKVVLYFMEAGTMKRTTIPEQLLEKIKPWFSS